MCRAFQLSRDGPAGGDSLAPGLVAAVKFGGRAGPSGRAGFDDPELLGHRFEQSAVMGNKQERARPVAEEELECLASRNVQVVRRLIEQQQVGRRDSEQRQLQA